MKIPGLMAAVMIGLAAAPFAPTPGLAAATAEEPSEDAELAAGEPEGRRLDPEKLAGEHEVTGRNPDGSAYRGRVIIRAKGGLLLFQWTVGDAVTHGTGLLEDMTVGVALDNGVAIYQAVPQAEGISLIGLWKSAGAKKACEETILVGNADSTEASFEVRPMNGEYQFRRNLPDGDILRGRMKISGGDILKKVALSLPDDSFEGEGLALGDGLAVITPEGLAVYALSAEAGHFTGTSVNARAQILPESLATSK